MGLYLVAEQDDVVSFDQRVQLTTLEELLKELVVLLSLRLHVLVKSLHRERPLAPSLCGTINGEVLSLT